MKFAGRMLPETARHFFKKPATVMYPFQKLPVPAGLRGAPVVNENTCIGCKICARECPAGAIEMVDVGVKFPRPKFYYDRCIYCAVCSDVCPKKSIQLTNAFELASTERGSLFRQPQKPQETGEVKVEDNKQE